MRVEYSRTVRYQYPVGTLFLIQAKLVTREGGTTFLYAHPSTAYRVITDTESRKILPNLSGF